MKIYSIQPDGNEAAELEPAHYFNLAIQQIEKNEQKLKKSDKPVQVMLVHIDVLLYICRKYPVMANLRLESDHIKQWRNTFDKWYERCSSRIPVAYRAGIKETSDTLFNELIHYGH